MNRRRFIGLSAVSGGGILVAGTAYRLLRPSDPLHSFHESAKKALAAHFGNNRAAGMLKDIQAEYASIAPTLPYIGARKSMFAEWLDYGVYYLAVYRVLKRLRFSVEQAGEIIYRTYEIMADYPKWFLDLVGRLKYGKSYVSRLKIATEESQSRQDPAGWVAAFVNGDGRDFDYGLVDITECGICRLYAAHNVQELAPYLCLSDFVVSKAFDRGLVRHYTIAEGSERCDFRYKSGRETFVYPLRDGWPPRFSGR